MDYRKLSTYEKIEEIQGICFCQVERPHVAKYMTALRQGDTQTVEEYESFGDAPRQIILNKRTYEQGLLFGFTEKKFNEYGWMKNEDFQEKETFEFTHKEGWAAHNYLTIGRGLNGVWTFGAGYSTGGHGVSYGISVWGKRFDSRKECLTVALQEILDGHKQSAVSLKGDSANFNAKLSNIIVKQVKDMFDTITGRKGVQLSLF